ncbi:hypothetical protein ES708_18487 [subsurface metagenome]
MDGERIIDDYEAKVAADKARVDEVVDEVKAVVEQPEAEVPVKSVYDDFVEGVATREIAKAHGAKAEAARVFETRGDDGEPVVNIAGEGKVVSAIGDILERGGYNVQEWHIKRPDDVSREAEKVRPALDDLIKSVPIPILENPGEFIRKAIGLPLKAITAGGEAIDEAAGKIDEAAEAIKEFKKDGGQDGNTE